MSKNLTVTSSPHRRDSISTQKIMLMVIIALLPSVVASAIYFGGRAILLIAVCVATCVLTEFICRKLMKRNQTISDLSACVTGILLALNLPVTLPIWEAIIGSFVAIAVVKQLFGGIGQNFANPAIVGRIVLMLSFTADMTTWAIPKYYQASEGVITGATPLVSGDSSYMDLFLGNVGGCLGETSALAILIGGLFLIVMRVITPSAPISFIGTVALLTFITGGDVLYQVLAGGLLLGAFFMATDYSTTPITEKGKIIFGIGCGIITFVIRNYGGYPEGVSFSILLMNILTPYIDRLTMTKPVGAKYPEKNKEEVSK
ncbi:MAG: RnfABCDGE type electron transport complex subunit D [Ruminococcus sp.]|nr:RnfABCDGE type electron transport complex subunit D [Ruminococcus sp.]MCD7800396.1 RnfABCDGE type electron transport complex subunit D [Ruminococcus sp.]